MHMKITFALSALVLCLSTSIRALPLAETQEVAERDSDILERSLTDFDLEGLATREIFDDALDALVARAKKKSATPSPKTPPKKAAPPAGAKGAAMKTHVATQRAAKNAAKQAQRGGPISAAKQAKITEKKENRALAKKQKFQAGKDAGKYKIGLNGKPVDKNTPMTKGEKQARTNRKAAGKAAYDAMSPAQKTAKANKQAADRTAAAATKDARRNAKIANKATARTNAKADRKAQMTQARTDYHASIGTGTFPGRKTTFTTPQGKNYNGRDVRQALFNGHAASQPGKGVGYSSSNGKAAKPRDQHPKTFDNRPNKSGGKPLPGMTGSGREFGMTHNSVKGYDGRQPNPTDPRLITQKGASGAHEFRGVVAHPAGTDDHVQVHGVP